MLNVECVDSAELELYSYHAHVEIDCLEFAGLVVKFGSLDHFEDTFELFVSELHVLTGLVGFFFGAVAAGDVVEQAELEVEIFFWAPLSHPTMWCSVNLIRAIHL